MSDIEDSYSKKKSDVYLAYVDAPIKENDKLSIADTFIGGSPIWLHPDSIPESSMLQCSSCKSDKFMKLLIQAFAPIDKEQMEPILSNLQLQHPTFEFNDSYISGDDDRILYVFTCTNCPRKLGGMKCIRGVLRDNNNKTQIDEIVKDETMGKKFDINPFDISSNTDSNPFSTIGNTTNTENPFAINMTTDSTIQTNNNKKEENKLSRKALRNLHDEETDKEHNSEREFKGFLLYVEQETFQHKPDHLKLPKNLKIDKEALELSEEKIIDTEELEKDPIKMDPRTEKLSQFLDDDVFQKFQEIVAYNPLQVLRYDMGGKPLYYAATKPLLDTIIPNPEFNKNSKRVFEMQLMPKMIMDLEENEVSVNDGMEWGTILIFTDAENHTPKFDKNGVGYVEECVRVQWEKRS